MKPEYADVVGELRQRTVPLPSRLGVLGTRVSQRRLRDEQIYNATDSLAIPPARDALGFGCTGEQVRRGAHAVRGRLQIVICCEHLQRDLLTRLLHSRVRGVQLVRRRTKRVLP